MKDILSSAFLRIFQLQACTLQIVSRTCHLLLTTSSYFVITFGNCSVAKWVHLCMEPVVVDRVTAVLVVAVRGEADEPELALADELVEEAAGVAWAPLLLESLP
jgi:hypothetical protein